MKVKKLNMNYGIEQMSSKTWKINLFGKYFTVIKEGNLYHAENDYTYCRDINGVVVNFIWSSI